MTGIPERIGSYPIEREVGRGGMGVVYLGRDPRLERRVAIKVLPEALAADPERLARFEREARLLASLHHPNIAGIYGLEEDGGRRFLVLEYVEGETLAERLARGPLPIEDAIETCRQIAAALEAAHENGIVHRDLKPGNVKLTPSGEVKVLDFGLAKGGGAGSPSSSTNLSQSPTLAPAATMEGVILGTAAYMSPEQARGRAVDKRTDIWAFGCVLFECLTGQQAFAGETVSDTIARILQGEPAWDELPAKTPERMRGLLRRCLDKDARRRLRDVGDAKIELEDLQAVGASSSSLRAGAGARSGLGRYGREIGIALFVAVISVLATVLAMRVIRFGPERSARLPSRFEALEPPGAKFEEDAQSVSISPDGRMVAFIAQDSLQVGHLWVRPLDSVMAKQLPGPDGPELGLFWSPDSRKIGFFTATKLEVIAADGNSPAEALCDVKRARGGAWSKDGTILFAPFSNGALYRISAEGGDPKPVTTIDSTRGETGQRFPVLLPDGKHFLYSSLPGREGTLEIRLASLDQPRAKTVLTSESGVVYSHGYLLTTRNGRLVAYRWKGNGVAGEPIPIGDAPIGSSLSGSPSVSASQEGTAVYLPMRFPATRLVWMDLHRHELETIPLDPGPNQVQGLSPDDRFAVLARPESATQRDLWTVDLARGVTTRLTYDTGNSVNPRWSGDGKSIAYMWENQASPQVLKIRNVGGGGEVQTYLASDPLFKQLDDWSRDGQYIVYDRQDPATRWDIWLLPLTGDRKPRPYLVTPFSEQGGQISRDGRWLAYTSDESGSPEVYVQSFPTAGGKYQVTTHGGILAGWSPDGKGLIYSTRENPKAGFLVDVLPGAEFRTGPPRQVAEVPDEATGVALTHDGKRLLCSLLVGKQPPRALTVLLNWPAALARR